ncbi:probable chromosome partitioning related protein [Aromatoleum aromaticum EbN1]|uniref:Probable chromosome partitioning related protein n=1 Tax=Aromatoleum aromaticum (strain DSM 19018 / LMG 30748 / EbN1) TaxID=76114 RepID=Q5P8N8_AROAE|nr:ParA family protein [Aromatoleum aromaticum]CAI06321.1 probable chromosome partitioning related protein [Aromatoleum aromaticum EbN1]
MIVYSVVSTKGGVGKTTLNANLGALLADLGMRVLLIDADVQPSLSRYFPIGRLAPHGLTQMIKQGALTADCISTIDLALAPSAPRGKPRLNPNGCLDLVVSDAPEGTLQDWLAPRMDSALRIKLALRSPLISEHYDVVMIDTQGAVGHLQDAAVLAADRLLSPVSPDILSAREFLDGTQKLLDRVETASAFGFSVPAMQAILYRQENTRDAREIVKAIRDEYRKLKCRVSVLDTVVPHAVAYKSAATAQLPVHWIDPARARETMHTLLWELIPSLAGNHAGGPATALRAEVGDDIQDATA